MALLPVTIVTPIEVVVSIAGRVMPLNGINCLHLTVSTNRRADEYRPPVILFCPYGLKKLYWLNR
jgi:hypothetical protein